MRSRHFSIRSFTAVFLTLLVLCGFGYNLYDIQIVNEEYYKAQNNAVKTYTVSIEAARGEIVDRNGNSLVTNRQGNSIILDAAYFPSSKNNKERNEIILNLIRLFEANGEEYVNNIPLQLSGESVYFTDDEKAINTMKEAGIPAESNKTETEDYIEFFVRIPKNPQKVTENASGAEINSA